MVIIENKEGRFDRRLRNTWMLSLLLAGYMYSGSVESKISDVYVNPSKTIVYKGCEGISYGVQVPKIFADATALQIVHGSLETSLKSNNGTMIAQTTLPLREGYNDMKLGYAPPHDTSGILEGSANLRIGNVTVYSFEDSEPFHIACEDIHAQMK